MHVGGLVDAAQSLCPGPAAEGQHGLRRMPSGRPGDERVPAQGTTQKTGTVVPGIAVKEGGLLEPRVAGGVPGQHLGGLVHRQRQSGVLAHRIDELLGRVRSCLQHVVEGS